jgi:hypothetical protein
VLDAQQSLHARARRGRRGKRRPGPRLRREGVQSRRCAELRGRATLTSLRPVLPPLRECTRRRDPGRSDSTPKSQVRDAFVADLAIAIRVRSAGEPRADGVPEDARLQLTPLVQLGLGARRRAPGDRRERLCASPIWLGGGDGGAATDLLPARPSSRGRPKSTCRRSACRRDAARNR